MPVPVSVRFFLQVFAEGLLQVYAGLIGQADQHKQYIGHFVREVSGSASGQFRRFEGLLSVQPRHQACYLADFFYQNGHIGQFVIVPDADGIDPLINRLLRLAYRHAPLFILFIQPFGASVIKMPFIATRQDIGEQVSDLPFIQSIQ